MSIKRIIPDITTTNMDENAGFYGRFLGMDLAMDMGWIQTFVSPLNPTAQVTLLRTPPEGIPNPALSMEVEDVEALHQRALDLGLDIVYPLTDEPWGVRRFFVKDPHKTIINLLSHLA